VSSDIVVIMLLKTKLQENYWCTFLTRILWTTYSMECFSEWCTYMIFWPSQSLGV